MSLQSRTWSVDPNNRRTGQPAQWPGNGSGSLRDTEAASAPGRDETASPTQHWILKVLEVVLLFGLASRLTVPYLPHPAPGEVRHASSRDLLPDVLMVSDNRSDQSAVILATQARGHKVRQVNNAEAALETVQHDPDHIQIVVVDNDMAGAQGLISRVTEQCPAAHLVVLTGARDPGMISSMLVNAGMN